MPKLGFKEEIKTIRKQAEQKLLGALLSFTTGTLTPIKTFKQSFSQKTPNRGGQESC